MTALKAVFLSNWFDNPYKELLIGGLNRQGIEVSEYFRSTFFIQNVLKNGKPDVVHLQTLHYFFASRNPIFYWFKFLIFIAQLLLLRAAGTKTVWTVHEWTDKISGGKHDLSLRQAALLGKVLAAVITHCDSTRQEMIAALHLENPDKVFVVPHGHYIDYYENVMQVVDAKTKLKLDPRTTVFLYFGGIHPSKGVLEAISAFKAVADSRSQLVLAGKAGYAKIRDDILSAVDGAENIHFVDPEDHIPDQDIQLYMNAADAVLLPYKVFTTSGVALLAMSFKKACIAPSIGFFQDILDESGAFLYSPNTQFALQQAITAAIEKRTNLTEMGMHNFTLAQGYDWDTISHETACIYGSL